MSIREDSESTVARAIAEQAQSWVIENRDRTMSMEQRSEFLAWLRTSPAHVREYLAVAQLGSDLRGALSSYSVDASQLVKAALAESDDNVVQLAVARAAVVQPAERQRWIFYATAASMAFLGILGWWGTLHLDAGHKEYRTAHGEQRTVRLDDGSVLHMNSDSIVRVAFSGAERGIVMERGQELFKVAKDKTRPFRVRAAGTEVVAVGTEFDVRRQARIGHGEDVVVTVVEGAVTVSDVSRVTERTHVPSGQRDLTLGMVAPVRLGAGQQARVTHPIEPSIGPAPDKRDLQVRSVDVRPTVAWVQQQVIFERESLDAVVKEFSRYGAMPMVIEDRDLAGLRISGVFNAYDLESFVGFLEQVEGIAVRRDVDRIRISIIKTDGE